MPTAVRATLRAARARYGDRRLVAIFEPRTNTSRRAVFQEDYAEAFVEADRAVLRIVPDEPIYSATGEVTERLDATQLARAIAERGTPARALPSVDAIVEDVVAGAERGDVALVMSNGAFDGIHEALLTALEGRSGGAPQ